MTDSHTAEQQLGDVAAQLLERLAKLQGEFFLTGAALAMLAQYNGDTELARAAEAARMLVSEDIAERVRDAAAVLPLRGLEFGAP